MFVKQEDAIPIDFYKKIVNFHISKRKYYLTLIFQEITGVSVNLIHMYFAYVYRDGNNKIYYKNTS